MSEQPGVIDMRVLILAPVGRDAALTAKILAGAELPSAICRGADELSAHIAEGAGAVLLTEEALDAQTFERLRVALVAQPPWSNLPIVLLLDARRDRRAPATMDRVVRRFGPARRVILLNRPLPVRTVVSVLQSAVAARARQYQVRDLVAQLEALNENLETRVAERTALALQRAEQLRALSVELIGAEAREQRRIAQLLHDDLQQILVAARLHLKALRSVRRAAEKDMFADEVNGLLERSIEATRSLTVEFSPPVLYERGLSAALHWLAADARRQHGVEVTVEVDAVDDEPQSAELRVFLFRAVRELVFNAVKHAGGSSAVRITMECCIENTLRIVVADEGVGFDPGVLATRDFGRGGYGLANIRQRAASLGGELRIESAPGRGTRVTLLTPVSQTRPAATAPREQA